LTNVRITKFRQCRDLVRESEMFIKDKAKIAGRVSGDKRSVLYFSELLSVTNEEKFRFRRVESWDECLVFSGTDGDARELVCTS